MRVLPLVFLAVALCLSGSAVAVEGQTLCSTYSNSVVSATQLVFLQSIVNQVWTGPSATVGGLVNISSPVLNVFSAGAPGTIYSYIAGTLANNNMISFLSLGLGCVTTAPAPLPVVNSVVINAVAAEGVQQADMDVFISLVSTACLNAGVLPTDVQSVVVPYMNTFLECGTYPICAGDSCAVAPTALIPCAMTQLQVSFLHAIDANPPTVSLGSGTQNYLFTIIWASMLTAVGALLLLIGCVYTCKPLKHVYSAGRG